MRIFAIVFGSLLVVVGLLVGAWFVRERVILTIASQNLVKDMTLLKKMAADRAKSSECYSDDVPADEDAVLGYQLRFIGDTEYQIEVVCNQTVTPAVELSRGKLFGGTVRQYGSGVFIDADDDAVPPNGWVLLRFGNRTTAVGLFAGLSEVRQDGLALPVGGDTPARAGCTDWGFQCCDQKKSMGTGAQVFTADCGNQCYQHCNQLPLVLFFNSDPMMDETKRKLFLRATKADVRFGFAVTDADDGIQRTTISFGDGTIADNLGAKSNEVVHTYTCTKSQCSYTATLTAWDTGGNASAALPVSTIQIVMQP